MGSSQRCNLAVIRLTTRLHLDHTVFARFVPSVLIAWPRFAARGRARANVPLMEHEDVAETPSVDDITTRALAKARQEFEAREARAGEEIGRAVRSFQLIGKLDQELREARADLESALDTLAGLDVNRSVIAEALGITEGTLARRLPRKRKSPRTSSTSRRAQLRPSDDTSSDVI